jgi:hypothetical protein
MVISGAYRFVLLISCLPAESNKTAYLIQIIFFRLIASAHILKRSYGKRLLLELLLRQFASFTLAKSRINLFQKRAHQSMAGIDVNSL